MSHKTDNQSKNEGGLAKPGAFNSLASKFSGLGSIKNAEGANSQASTNPFMKEADAGLKENSKMSVSSKFNFAAYLQSNDVPSGMSMTNPFEA